MSHATNWCGEGCDRVPLLSELSSPRGSIVMSEQARHHSFGVLADGLGKHPVTTIPTICSVHRSMTSIQ